MRKRSLGVALLFIPLLQLSTRIGVRVSLQKLSFVEYRAKPSDVPICEAELKSLRTCFSNSCL
ncbi:hypothetical protein KC19_1G301700 [Ceratodon purpureus]|uniref:Uncharacterized protein n=1 Tax=Ceratodon purpureus TaxID=3225 RepID=A0A8T0JDB4_CERPU|nr:hypothetical protein KC19_1G301700 [Ceratodon purpureus]